MKTGGGRMRPGCLPKNLPSPLVGEGSGVRGEGGERDVARSIVSATCRKRDDA